MQIPMFPCGQNRFRLLQTLFRHKDGYLSQSIYGQSINQAYRFALRSRRDSSGSQSHEDRLGADAAWYLRQFHFFEM